MAHGVKNMDVLDINKPLRVNAVYVANIYSCHTNNRRFGRYRTFRGLIMFRARIQNRNHERIRHS